MIGSGMPIAQSRTERMRLSIFHWGDNQQLEMQFQTLSHGDTAGGPATRRVKRL